MQKLESCFEPLALHLRYRDLSNESASQFKCKQMTTRNQLVRETQNERSLILAVMQFQNYKRMESVMFLILTQVLVFGGGIATALFVVTIVGSEIKADPIVG